MRVVTFVTFFTLALAGCSGIPSVPYEEPAQSEGLARLRVITNSSVYGDSITGSCAPATRHKMADAGRFGRDGTANINYPQYPLKSASVGMPKRVAPTLTEYVPAVRMGEGVYKEVVTEYRVRTDLPFQIATLGATIGGYGSTYSSCGGQALVYKLESGKNYEVLVGVGSRPSSDGGQALTCMLGVIELMPLAGTSIVIPQMLTPSAPPQVACKN
ncbi:hypothetical protein [Pseudomonas fluorescens]|uniref:hypothetical protein n=1 Tax=Pseudomonas fluorescens TaxID=294 RepID=UPI00124115D8|nr:hypothetical protein [Pseudomonas fluorescens]VVN46987.1 hypothetical protein PS676_05838 [Pseudomonas fluorescens]